MSEKTEATKSARTLRNKRLVKRLLLSVVGLVICGAVVVAALPKPIPVEVVQARRGELVLTVDEDGTARVKDRYVISAPLAGNLARIERRAGDEVKQGDILARIVPSKAPLLDARSKSQTEAEVAASSAGVKQARAQVERAQVALDFAKREAVRYKELLAQKVVSEQELERLMLDQYSKEAELTSARFGEKVAAHKLTMSQAALGHYEDSDAHEMLTVTSPVSGRVLKLIEQSEGVIQAGTPLLEVGDPKALEIVVDVLTSDAVNIQPGNHARIVEWGGEPLEAVVRTIEPSAFTRVSALGVDEQRVNAVLDLRSAYENWARLGDGYRVEAQIQVFRAGDVVLAPQSSLFRHEGKWATFTVVNDAAHLQLVEVGHRNKSQAELVSGIAAGARLIVHPSDKVSEGVKIAPLP